MSQFSAFLGLSRHPGEAVGGQADLFMLDDDAEPTAPSASVEHEEDHDRPEDE